MVRKASLQLAAMVGELAHKWLDQKANKNADRA